MKKLIAILIIILLIAAGILYLNQSNQATSTPSVRVTKNTIVEKAEAIGYIKPLHFNTIKSQVGGTVYQIYRHEGDFVKTGDPLISIKPAPAPADYATAYEGVQEAETNKANSLHNFQRYQSALKTHLITRNYTDYIAAKKTYQASVSQYTLAKQKLALLEKGKTNVGKKVIANIVTSPINGYILYRNVDVGDPVISLSSAQSATALFTMANMNDLMFQGSVDEMDAAKLNKGMPATITIGALPNKKIKGNITRISLQSDQENENTAGAKVDANLPFSVSFQIEIANLKIPKDTTLRSGYSSTADINLKTAKEAPTLPARVIHFADDKSYVLLPAKAGEKPAEKTITTGLSDGINVEIKSGLKLGDKVLDVATMPATKSKQPKLKHHGGKRR